MHCSKFVQLCSASSHLFDFVSEHLDRLCQRQLSAALKSLTRGLHIAVG